MVVIIMISSSSDLLLVGQHVLRGARRGDVYAGGLEKDTFS